MRRVEDIDRIKLIAAELSLIAVRLGRLVESLSVKPSMVLVDDRNFDQKNVLQIFTKEPLEPESN